MSRQLGCRPRRTGLVLAGLVLGLLASSCTHPLTEAVRSPTVVGSVRVEAGSPDRGPDRGLWADTSITQVEVLVTDSHDQPAGTGLLGRGATGWSGDIEVTALGSLEFEVLAKNKDALVVWEGRKTQLITAPGASVSVAVAVAALVRVTTGTPGPAGVPVRDAAGQEVLEFRFQFSASLDSQVKGTLTFDQPRRVYRSGARPGAVGALLEEEAAITFATTRFPQDTLVVKPSFGYAAQTYSHPLLEGFAAPGGRALGAQTDPDWTASTAPLAMTNLVRDWRDRILYFALTDRVADGDPSNNQQVASGTLDAVPGDGRTYQGGDLKGLKDKIPYLHDLGINALWITSPLRQAWEYGPYTSYHGYWAQDFTAVDPHLGTLRDLRDLVAAAHAAGIAVVMDVVVNHVGPVSFYDLNGDGATQSNEWQVPFAATAQSSHRWLEDLASTRDEALLTNRIRPGFGALPAGKSVDDFLTRQGGEATTGSGAEVTQGDFVGLRDVNTRDPAVRTRLTELFQWWIANTDVDGFRIDTVKHVEPEFWTAFCSDLRAYARSLTTIPSGGKSFFTLAEVYDGTAAGTGTFTKTGMLDSVLGFPMAEAVFDWNSGDNTTVFKDTGLWTSRPKTKSLELKGQEVAAAPSLQTVQAQGDGQTARSKIGYFLDNHDLNRFLNGTSGTDNETASAGEVANLEAALAWLLTWEGMPVLYYGTEQAYKQTLALAPDGENGSGAGNVNKGNRPNLWQIANGNNGNTPFSESSEVFRWIAGLNALRTGLPALSHGQVSVRWSDDGVGSANDDGVLAYLRRSPTNSPADDVLVVINTHPTQDSAPSAGSGNDLGTDWPVGTELEVVPIPGFEGSGTAGTSEVDRDGSAGRDWSTRVTTFAQAGKTSAVYFQLPPRSVRILRRVP